MPRASPEPPPSKAHQSSEYPEVSRPPSEKLLIKVHHASGMRGSRADPFVEVFFKNFAENDAFVGETIVRKRTMEPSWEDQAPLELRVPSRAYKGAGLPLVFHVLDWDRIGKNDMLGEAQLAPADWRKGCSRVALHLQQQQIEGSASRGSVDKQASGVVVVSCEWADTSTGGGGVYDDEAPDAAHAEAPAKIVAVSCDAAMPEGADPGVMVADRSGSINAREGLADSDADVPADAEPNGMSVGPTSSGDHSDARSRRGDIKKRAVDDVALRTPQLPLGPCEIFVRVHEGREFAAADQRPQTGDNLVKVAFNEETQHTSTVHSTNNPVWNDRMSFHFEVDPEHDFHGFQMLFEGWDSDWLADDLLGAFELDLAWVWKQEHHEIQQTWIALADTGGALRGYLLVSVAIVPEGYELNTVAPKLDTPADLSLSLLPPSVELHCQELHVNVYYAEDIAALDRDGHSDLYLRVSYGTQSVQSSVMQKAEGVHQAYEELTVPVVCPRLNRDMVSQRVLVTLCDKDRFSRDDVIGVAYINLSDVPQRQDSPHSKMWGVPTWVNLYGAPAHAGGAGNTDGSTLMGKLARQYESSRNELTRKMNSGKIPGCTYRGRVMISAFLKDVDEAKADVYELPQIQKVEPGGRAREVAGLMNLRLESLSQTNVKQKGPNYNKLPQSSWRDLRRDEHNPDSSAATPGSLLVCLASDAGLLRPPPSRSQPRAPEGGLCVIRALILEGHGLQRTTKVRSQWVSVNLTAGTTTVSTRRVELKDEHWEDSSGSYRVQFDELLELVIDCPKDTNVLQDSQSRSGVRLLPPDIFLELMLGSAYGEQKRLSYTRIKASELFEVSPVQDNPDCMIQDTISKRSFKDKVFSAGYIPWTSSALGVRCVDAKDLYKTDTLNDPDYYVRITLYSGPDDERQIPSPDKICQEEDHCTLSYSAPSRTQDVQMNDDGIVVWNEFFRFGTALPDGEYSMPDVQFVVVDVFDEDFGQDDHVGRALIRVRDTDHGYEVDHGRSGYPEFRAVGDMKGNSWPLYHHADEVRRQQGSITLVFTEHAFVPRREWRGEGGMHSYEMRVHVFSAQDLCVKDIDGINEVFLRGSMGSSDGRTRDGKSKTKTRSGPGPIWNQTLLFDDVQLLSLQHTQAGLAPRLVLTLWDRDTGSTPDFLAQCCVTPTQIFEASRKMDKYLAKTSGHPAEWYPLFEQDSVTRAGKVLLAFEVCKHADAQKRVWLDSTFSEKQRTSGQCTPRVRKCRLEMLIVGCRDLKSWGLSSDPTAPYVEMSVSNKKRGVGKSASTLPRRKPHSRSPSYINDGMLHIECEVPEDPLFEPHAVAMVQDNPKFTLDQQRTLGQCRIDLTPHLPWIQENQESQSRQMMDQMIHVQKTMGNMTDPILGSNPELHAALKMDKIEPWDDISLAKFELERTLYALLNAEQQLESLREIDSEAEYPVNHKHQILVEKSFAQCEKIASAALKLVQTNLRQNPATEDHKLDLWYVIESDCTDEHVMQHFEATRLAIDSTVEDDVAGSADADDLKDFRRHALLAEQLALKTTLYACQRLVATTAHVAAQRESTLTASTETAWKRDINTLARKCDIHANCIRESVKSFGAGSKAPVQHARLTKLMTSECLSRCRAVLPEDGHGEDARKSKAVEAVCSALEEKLNALQVSPDTNAPALDAIDKSAHQSCNKLSRCWCTDNAAEKPQFTRLNETDANQLIEGVRHERLVMQFPLPTWMLNRKVIDDELEDELERLPDSSSFGTIMTWKIMNLDDEVGKLKGVIRVVDISADTSEPEPELEPESAPSDTFGGRALTELSQHTMAGNSTELPFPRLLPELLHNHELIARVYVTQAFLPFKDSNKLLGPDAEWYIKILLDSKELNRSLAITAGDPSRPYLGCVFEFPVTLPGPSAMRLELYDQDKFSGNELIGGTNIDLENRYFNDGWRALGQPVHATTATLAHLSNDRTAEAATADNIGALDSSSWRFAGCCNLLSLSTGSKNESEEDQEPLQPLEVGRNSLQGPQHNPADAGGKIDVSPEDESQLALQKPIERRTLRLPGSNRFQGKLEMWLDLLTQKQAAFLDPVDIRPPQRHSFELRIVVWSVRGCPISDSVTKTSDLTVSTDLHVVESSDERESSVLTQDTDTHWRSRDGNGNFNWRIVYDDIPLPQPLNSPCRLSLNVYDSDPLLVSKELLGTADVDMRKLLFRKAISHQVAAKHKGVLSTRIYAMSTKQLRYQLRQLGEHYDSSATRAELATALE